MRFVDAFWKTLKYYFFLGVALWMKTFMVHWFPTQIPCLVKPAVSQSNCKFSWSTTSCELMDGSSWSDTCRQAFTKDRSLLGGVFLLFQFLPFQLKVVFKRMKYVKKCNLRCSLRLLFFWVKYNTSDELLN